MLKLFKVSANCKFFGELGYTDFHSLNDWRPFSILWACWGYQLWSLFQEDQFSVNQFWKSEEIYRFVSWLVL